MTQIISESVLLGAAPLHACEADNQLPPKRILSLRVQKKKKDLDGLTLCPGSDTQDQRQLKQPDLGSNQRDPVEVSIAPTEAEMLSHLILVEAL